MSVQLIVYPQTFKGESNPLALTNQQFVVDGFNFVSMNVSTTYNSASTLGQNILAGSPPAIVNNWYRWRHPDSGTQPDFPTSAGGLLSLNGDAATDGESGVYQRLSNLIVGQSYDITISTQTPSSVEGVLSVQIYDGTNIVTPTSSSSGVIQGVDITESFIATASDNTLFIKYFTIGSDTTDVITKISITGQGFTPFGQTDHLGDGQVICDLYEDEDIPLTLSVDDFKNVAEQVQSYSKAFKLPATKRNNQIFENMFDITRSAEGYLSFNPYVKTQCVLKEDGFLLFEGYLKLIDIQDKEGEISYNVNLYSEVVSLADTLGEKTFAEIDLSELSHLYNLTNIKASWSGLLTVVDPLPITSFANNTGVAGATTTNVLKYPFVDWEHSYTYNLVTGFPILPSLESSFRPFIRLKYLIEKIFAPTPFTFTSAFFDSGEFSKLYMDFNWGNETVPLVFSNTGGLTMIGDYQITSSYATVEFNQLSAIPNFYNTGSLLPSVMGYSSGVFTATNNNQWYTVSSNIKFESSTGADPSTLNCEWVHTLASGVEVLHEVDNGQVISASTYYIYQAFFFAVLQAGETLEFRAKDTGSGSPDLEIDNGLTGGIYNNLVNVGTYLLEITSDALLKSLRGELGQWEFLKGIMTMFNLVSIPDQNNPNNILIEPYNDIFLHNADSTELDWTDKIDIAEMKLTPLTDLNKSTIFKFVEDDDDHVFNQYKRDVQGHLYGSKLVDMSTSAQGFESILEGKKEIIAEPFAATVVKPLMQQFSDFIVPAIYSYNPDDDTSEGFDNAPRIMTSNGIRTAASSQFVSCTYGVPGQNGVAGGSQDSFLQFSHLSAIPTASSTVDYHFGLCQLVPPVGAGTTNNLFNTYWRPYFNELYHPDTRTMSIKVNLSASDINTFKFYDTVYLKNRTFRVNKIDYKPNDLSTVEFILIP